MLEVSLLGCGGMMPLPHRFLTAMFFRYKGKMLLIDCGEGTQITAKLQGWGFKNIDVICFTHYHADHISGLPGLLLAIGNSGRSEPITLLGPRGLTEIFNGLSVVFPELPFDVSIIEFEKDFEQFKIGEFVITAVKAEHLVTCFGYSIEILRGGKFYLEKAEELALPRSMWSILQKGESVEHNGVIYTSDMVLGEDRKGIKVTYFTDTRPIDALVELSKNSDLLVCEGLYGEEEKKEKAIDKRHMIFSEAGEVAKKANVKKLWLTHFSPALSEPELFLDDVKKIFENTFLGYDRISDVLNFEE